MPCPKTGMTVLPVYLRVAHDQLNYPVLLKEDIGYVNSMGIFLVVIHFKFDREAICDPTEQ